MIALCTIVMLMCSSMHLSAADPAPGDDNLDLGAIEDISAASAVSPELIGADGDDFTQVAAAQALGWTGWGVRLCLIDDALDIYHPNFGNCTGVRQPGYPTCRVYWGWNGGYGSDGFTRGNSSDPTPKSFGQSHGTHVAGIMAGSFPAKLTDSKGKPLPYQRGVAYRAMIGIFKVMSDSSTGALELPAIVKALRLAPKAKCRVINMSLGTSLDSGGLSAAVSALREADVMQVVAAGNSGDYGGPVLFSMLMPGSFPEVLAVAHLNNSASPGSLLQLDRAIPTSTGDRDTLVAVQRADTAGSPCMPSCDNLKLPLEIFLLKTTPASEWCTPLDWISKPPDTLRAAKGKVLLLQITTECASSLGTTSFWFNIPEVAPALVLLALESDEYAFDNSDIGTPKQTVPVMWMRSDDGMALAQAVAAADPANPIKLTKVPGATVADLPEEYARQPNAMSSQGPAADLSIKPDISAPGTLFSSVPEKSYETWPGTSMASPYVAGVAGLWLESKLKASAFAPEGGWTQAAFVALQNTARPWPFPGSDLMWPPAKVGAGVVQAKNVILNTVSITPRAVSLRTDVTSQRITLTLHNTGSTALTYKVTHKPAVGLSLSRAWYRRAYDTSAPTASVSFSPDTVTVAAGGTSTVTANVITTTALQARDDVIFSGYFTFTPTTGIPSTTANGKPFMSDPIVLSVPYQGASRDYSSAGSSGSSGLAVLPSADYSLDPAQASLAARGAYFCYKYTPSDGSCKYNPTGISDVPESGYHLFAMPLLRPMADYKIQVWNQEGSQLLGTSLGLGALQSAAPLDKAQDIDWYGLYVPINATNKTETVNLPIDVTVQFKVLLYPHMAAGDVAARRKKERMQPFVVPVAGFMRRVNGTGI